MKPQDVLAMMTFYRNPRPVITEYIKPKKTVAATMRPFLRKHLPDGTKIGNWKPVESDSGTHLFYAADVLICGKNQCRKNQWPAHKIGSVVLWWGPE